MSKQVQVRSILKHFVAKEQSEGIGARVRRSVGSMQVRKFSPFLLLDHFNVTPPAGFPDHPHHGQETITYIMGGKVAHEDFTGCKGILNKGDLQFMTAGKAVCHSEMPVKMDNGEPLTGLQLWVDLPTELKNCEPRYRDLRNEDIPIAKVSDGFTVDVISGKSYGVESLKELAYTPVDLYIFRAKKAGAKFTQEIPSNYNVFIYVMNGSISISDRVFPQYSSIFFKTDGNAISGVTSSNDVEFAIIGGKILEQETVQHGPFVEETTEKLIKVFHNYENYTGGFERALDWQSSIRHGINEEEAKYHSNVI